MVHLRVIDSKLAEIKASLRPSLSNLMQKFQNNPFIEALYRSIRPVCRIIPSIHKILELCFIGYISSFHNRQAQYRSRWRQRWATVPSRRYRQRCADLRWLYVLLKQWLWLRLLLHWHATTCSWLLFLIGRVKSLKMLKYIRERIEYTSRLEVVSLTYHITWHWSTYALLTKNLQRQKHHIRLTVLRRRCSRTTLLSPLK